MPFIYANTVEKDVFPIPAKAVVVPANVSTSVLPDVRTDGIIYVGRYIQNIGANSTYYAIGQDCDGVSEVNGLLAPGQQFDCSNHPSEVKCFSVAGTTIAPTMLKRVDMGTHGNILPANLP